MQLVSCSIKLSHEALQLLRKAIRVELSEKLLNCLHEQKKVLEDRIEIECCRSLSTMSIFKQNFECVCKHTLLITDFITQH